MPDFLYKLGGTVDASYDIIKSISPEEDVSDLTYFAEKGEFGLTTDSTGNVYIADGQVYVFDRTGKQLKVIKVPERPTSIVFGGQNNKTLYIIGTNSLYSINTE